MSFFPTLGSYSSARTGMMAMQLGMSVINNNIANAHTAGYSRQRIDLSASNPLGYLYLGNGQIGQLGSGVNVESISRAHSQFIDDQVNRQQGTLGYQSQISQTLIQVEGMIGEPAGTGITGAIQQFFDSAAALSHSPESVPIRHGFVQNAKALMLTVQNTAQQLKSLRTNLVGDPDAPTSVDGSMTALTIDSINTSLTQIANLNKEIVIINASGGSANDLLDKRDKLVGDVSTKLNITVTYRENGLLDISLGSNKLIQGSTLKDTLNVTANTGVTRYDTPALVQLASSGADVSSDITGGELGGILKMGGNSTDLSTPRGVIEKLDTLFSSLVAQVNTLQANGLKLNGTSPTVGTDDKLFIVGVGSDLSVFNTSLNTYFETHPESLAAAQGGIVKGVGDGRNALAISQIQTSSLAGLGNKKPGDFYNEMLSTLGVDAHSSSENAENATLISQQLEQQRQSFQGVNIEEEMVELVKYQRGFEASARAFKALDESIMSILQLL